MGLYPSIPHEEGLEALRDVPGVPKKSSGVWLNAEKKVLNLAISNQSSEMLDIST